MPDSKRSVTYTDGNTSALPRSLTLSAFGAQPSLSALAQRTLTTPTDLLMTYMHHGMALAITLV